MAMIGAKFKASAEDLNNLVQGFIADSFVMAERLFCKDGESPDIFVQKKDMRGKASVWDRGRIFNSASELRWEKNNAAFHLVWVSEADKDITADWKPEDITKVEDKGLYLWGEKNSAGAWFEKQIPRLLEYPAKGSNSRACIAVRHYRIDSDATEIYRFMEVKTK